MPEPARLMYELKELAEILVKEQKLKKGHWCLAVQYGLGAGLVQGSYQGKAGTTPTALVGMLSIGIQEIDAPNDISVDASKLHGGTNIRKTAIAKKATALAKAKAKARVRAKAKARVRAKVKARK